jgi:hypothetical protein
MVQQMQKPAIQQTSPCKLDGPTMKRLLFALLCALVIVAAQGRTLRQANETATSPASGAVVTFPRHLLKCPLLLPHLTEVAPSPASPEVLSSQPYL